MKKMLRVVVQLEKEGIIKKYAIGGATALLFYSEPALTFDVDIFVFLPEGKKNKILDLSPLYQALKDKGYGPEKEHVLIEGIPVQFIPAYNSLTEEAVSLAVEKEYDGIKIKVITLEYLLVIMLDTNRPKDKERIKKLLAEVQFNKKSLSKILGRHNLKKRWEKEIVEK